MPRQRPRLRKSAAFYLPTLLLFATKRYVYSATLQCSVIFTISRLPN